MRYLQYKISTGTPIGVVTQSLPPEDDDIIGYIEFPASFVDSEAYVVESKSLVYVGSRPSIDHELINKQWVLNRAQQNARMAELARVRRNELLTNSDWSDLASAPQRLGGQLYQQWQQYRQALRDITTQPGFPLNVIWPTPPG